MGDENFLIDILIKNKKESSVNRNKFGAGIGIIGMGTQNRERWCTYHFFLQSKIILKNNAFSFQKIQKEVLSFIG